MVTKGACWLIIVGGGGVVKFVWCRGDGRVIFIACCLVESSWPVFTWHRAAQGERRGYRNGGGAAEELATGVGFDGMTRYCYLFLAKYYGHRAEDGCRESRFTEDILPSCQGFDFTCVCPILTNDRGVPPSTRSRFEEEM